MSLKTTLISDIIKETVERNGYLHVWHGSEGGMVEAPHVCVMGRASARAALNAVGSDVCRVMALSRMKSGTTRGVFLKKDAFFGKGG